jgi:hypothetical protein
MLANGDGVDAKLIGQHGLLDDLPDRGGVRYRPAGIVQRHVAECVESESEFSHGGSVLGSA